MSSVAAYVSVSVSELEADRIVPVDSNRMGVPAWCSGRDGIGKERLQAHNQSCFSMHRKPGKPALSRLGAQHHPYLGRISRVRAVVWWGVVGTGARETETEARRCRNLERSLGGLV